MRINAMQMLHCADCCENWLDFLLSFNQRGTKRYRRRHFFELRIDSGIIVDDCRIDSQLDCPILQSTTTQRIESAIDANRVTIRIEVRNFLF
jgi:hypothetical protein